MQLRDFSLTCAEIPPGELLKAIETAVTPEVISLAIAQTKSGQRRHRRLPSHLIVTLVMAMSLWSADNIVDVLKNLVNGLSTQRIRLGQRWQTPTKSSIMEAREPVGCQVMSHLFANVARPRATEETPATFLQGLLPFLFPLPFKLQAKYC